MGHRHVLEHCHNLDCILMWEFYVYGHYKLLMLVPVAGYPLLQGQNDDQYSI